ncbi:MAG: hypothetical protein OEY93_01765 [Anaerolineae bacterium]|nr:hypothetical protein [Anaerolineae bacterium]
MSIHYDEKGKFYTDLVSKDSVRVIIQTTNQRILGSIYYKPNERLMDEINSQPVPFIAVTDADIYNSKGEKDIHVDFLTLNLSNVVWLAPANNE